MAKDYDSILQRLITIITKLANNERYTTNEFALEFGVSKRTIQKDIYERLLQSFPITKDSLGRFKFEDGFSLDKSMLDNQEMILLSLSLNCFNDSKDFSKTTQSILKKMLYPNFFNPYYIKKEQFENINIHSEVVHVIEEAIKTKSVCTITCSNRSNNTIKNKVVDIEPYKITSFDNFWYLFGKDISDNKIKTFMLSNIETIIPLNQTHNTNLKEIDSVLENIHSAWFDDGETFTVTIEVMPQIAQYFLKRNFLQSQTIKEEKSDGTLIISFEVTHDEDIDNLIKSWLPHVKVLEPVRFRDQIKYELERYIQEY